MTVVSTFYLVLLGVYALYATACNWSHRNRAGTPRAGRFVFWLQSPLFFVASYIAVRQGIFTRDLVSPFSIGLGLLLGHLIFGVSLWLTHQVLRDAWGHFCDLQALWAFLVENPSLLLRFTTVSLTEEMIYRAAAQPLLCNWTHWPLFSVVVVAISFSLVHDHFFRNPWMQSLEFLLFSLLLGALYYWTHSLSLVIVIHTLRNLESVYLEYLVKVDELGDAVLAQQAIDAAYALRPSERS